MAKNKIKKKFTTNVVIVLLVAVVLTVTIINVPIIPKYDTFNCLTEPCKQPMVSVYKKYFDITNFAECVAAGNPVMESHPRQCSAFGKTYTEEIIQIPDCNLEPC